QRAQRNHGVTAALLITSQRTAGGHGVFPPALSSDRTALCSAVVGPETGVVRRRRSRLLPPGGANRFYRLGWDPNRETSLPHGVQDLPESAPFSGKRATRPPSSENPSRMTHHRFPSRRSSPVPAGNSRGSFRPRSQLLRDLLRARRGADLDQ